MNRYRVADGGLSLGSLDGVEACRQIKATPMLQDIPIIMVPARDEVRCFDEALLYRGY